MKPKHVARARKLIGKKWYLRLRIRQNARQFRLWENRFVTCTGPMLERYATMMIHIYARKEAYYKQKLNSICGTKEAAQ